MNILIFLKNILQLLLSPAHGWEEISSEGRDPERLSNEGMYPLFGLAAATAFVQGIYIRNAEVGALLQLALVEFMALFVAYWIGAALLDNFINRFTDSDVSSKCCRTVAIYIASTLAIIQIIENLVPVEFTVIKFLPAFAAIVLWKATAYLSIKKSEEGRYIIFALAVMIIPWMLLTTILSLFL
ncbi:MAG: hypothetical protein J6C44_08940 [Muribaculaceae bacterium]|nr:hypothetical protein [Muribaculaceae bacterium]